MSNPLSGYAYMARRALEQNFNDRVRELEGDLLKLKCDFSTAVDKITELEIKCIELEHIIKLVRLRNDLKI